MTTSTDIPVATKVTLLKHLASGKSPDIVATIVGLKRDQVLDIASHHGYPDKDKLAWAADILEKKTDTEQAALPDRTGETRRDERRVAIADEPNAAPTPLTKPDEIRVLLNTAEGHGDGPTAAEVRAWAAVEGIDCPVVGRVPGAVREAYEAAHLQAAS